MTSPHLLNGIGRLLALLGFLILLTTAVWGEEPAPPAEYPYPQNSGDAGVDSSSSAKENDGADEARGSEKTDDFDTTSRSPIVGLPSDEAREVEEGFKHKIKEPQPRDPERTPVRVTAKGEYIYKVVESPQTRAVSLRFGAFSAPSLVNPTTNVRFQDIYGSSPTVMTFFDYEWQFFRGSLGKLGFNLGSGLMVAQGNGRFRKTDPNRNSQEAEEKFTGLLFPNNVAAVYRAQYKDKQLFVPYVNGGLDYFLFSEVRDDNKPLKYAGAFATHVALGVSFLMDWIDPSAINRLDKDYGINHIFLTAEYRMIEGLDSIYDYTNQVFNMGVSCEF